MIAKVLSAAVTGLEAELVEVEAVVSNGLPNTIIVGLPDTAVQESKERVKNAIKNSECTYPLTRVSLNLAPADVPKLGTHFDLPIALAIILASEQAFFNTQDRMFLGELSLDGHLRSVPGVLAITLKARSAGLKEIYVPKPNEKEASLVSGIKVYAVESISEILKHLLGQSLMTPSEIVVITDFLQEVKADLDMQDVAGQELAKRALEVAASGSHNLLSLWSQFDAAGTALIHWFQGLSSQGTCRSATLAGCQRRGRGDFVEISSTVGDNAGS